MGRLFWKFFLFIWLAQVVGMLGVGAVFWFDHQYPEALKGIHFPGEPPGADGGAPHEPEFGRQPPPGIAPAFPGEPPRPPLHKPGVRIPFLPFLGALLASLGCALGLAWYFAKPIRRLRSAFDAAAEGDLAVRVGDSMGGRRDELADLGRDFDRMTARLESSMGAQRQLLHDVSHEMRSPLARLQAAIGLARQQPERMDSSLERIERESERMNLLVGELLTLSRLGAGVTGMQESIDMSELLGNIVEDARFEGRVRGLKVDFVTGEMPDIRANGELLYRAIENVVRNALRYSPDGGVVRIEAGVQQGAFHLAICDRGPGVPEPDLENIFKPFFRGGAQVAGEGYGLGLAIASRVVGMLNGRIFAQNRSGGGLAVEMRLHLDGASLQKLT